ncbi:C3 Ren [Sesame yellow mosaic virus]|uniref:Replication enhancer n=1 Tax=Sesame yellow mosaic virus TaxID=2231646 RepID=A0A2Z4FSB4_9GEMI|nr:C3 Ren [Sesame yellow mosaic virus]AWV91699.1 C3 Ren [Sesame yellow mosaic virus]
MNVPTDFRTGEPITAMETMIGTYTWEVPNPLYLKQIYFHRFGEVFQARWQIRFNNNLRRHLNIHKCWMEFTMTGSHRNLTGQRFSTTFLRRLYKYLDNVGVISIQLVVKGIGHVLFDEFNFVSSISDQWYSISMKQY